MNKIIQVLILIFLVSIYFSYDFNLFNGLEYSLLILILTVDIISAILFLFFKMEKNKLLRNQYLKISTLMFLNCELNTNKNIFENYLYQRLFSYEKMNLKYDLNEN